ncbi:hypothetical protein Hamer_G006678 [Homarus americanus]|uniref:Uncharacterized protein n=1 Tax=Homarus americanus TaxID=6706 RepID=A0A8J5JLR5_HOMAM|nr:hypothetical protein Hamer_G006678 [Homarus americanus]
MKVTDEGGCAYAADSRMTCVAKAMRRLPDWASTTSCELLGILGSHRLLYLLDEQRSGLVIRSSETNPALPHKGEDGRLMHFIWIPSYIGLHKHHNVYNLAKSACIFPIPDDASTKTTGRVKMLLKKAVHQIIKEEQSEQRGASASVHHYDKHFSTKYQYGRNKCLTRLSDVVAARTRLGYMPCWELMRNPSLELTHCRIGGDNRKHSLQHYISEYRPIRSLFVT